MIRARNHFLRLENVFITCRYFSLLGTFQSWFCIFCALINSHILCSQLTEKSRVCFGKSGIHGWGLFARRSLQEGEMVLIVLHVNFVGRQHCFSFIRVCTLCSPLGFPLGKKNTILIQYWVLS